MAVVRHFSDEQERDFERELLSVLRHDNDHRFDFDGKLKVYSRRYGCMLQAVNVHWDERERDIVFVGAFRSGNPVMDNSSLYPKMKHEIAIPFRECFEDLKNMAGTNEMYLISKTRKAILDKCICKEVNIAKNFGLHRDGRIDFKDFSLEQVFIKNGAVPVGSVSVNDGNVSVVAANGMPIDIKEMSLREMQRVGDFVREHANGQYREARKLYTEVRSKFVRPNATVDDLTDRKGASEGLAAVYEKGFPLRICHGVAQTMSKINFGTVYDDSIHSVKDISMMLVKYHKDGKSFGFPDKRNGRSI